MKKSMSKLMMSVSTLLCLASCNLAGNSSVTTGGVTTGLKMTGSGQNAVAQTNYQKLFSIFIPTAVALTPPPLEDSTGSSVNLNEAWVVIKEIEFEAQEVADGNEQDGNEVEFEGPYFVDLLTDAPVSFGDASLPVSGIRRIKMKLHEAESLPAEAPLGLNGKSIYFSGSINGANFTYAADDSTELEIGGPSAILPNSAKDMLVVIRMADLFKKIDLSSISSSTDIHSGNRISAVGACPLIDASANDLYTCFRKGLSTEGNFGNDDGDDDLGPEDETVE
jgi:hypothetical protein